MLNINAIPIAISLYPLKSKYNWNVNANDESQASTKVSDCCTSNPSRTTGDKTSAIPTFLKIPMANTKIPRTI